ncbi:MAG: response regulator [Rhodospirillales bacterium]|nr:response regulator [Rhodospirillales bacterium]
MADSGALHEILLVDDDGADRQKIRRILTPIQGINVTEAHSGDHAMQILQSLNPALVITDIFMPNVDGLEFLTQLATTGWTFPVIAITGLNDSHHIDFLKVAQSFGAVHSMNKDELEEKLIPVVREILSQSGEEVKDDIKNRPFP